MLLQAEPHEPRLRDDADTALRGVRALLATSRDVRPILVPTSSPTENTTRTEVGIRFDGDEAAMTARWETIAAGQAALTLSRTLDRASERDRRAFCGEGPDADSTQAELDLLPGKAARLRCGVDVRAGGPGPGIGRYHFGWNGPWIAPLPDLPVGARVHPVLFDYPQVEFSDIEVTPPAGFVPGDLPEDRSFETPFGKCTDPTALCNGLGRVVFLFDQHDVPTRIAAPGDLAPGSQFLIKGVGTPNFGGPIVTGGGLVFIGAAMDNYLRAFDAASGKELWKGRLPAGGQATPMTYVWKGRQYVVISAGGHAKGDTKRGDQVVAFALPAR